MRAVYQRPVSGHRNEGGSNFAPSMLQHLHSVIASLLVALVVGACAENPYRTSNLQEVKADGMSVVITHARSEAEGRPLAEDYCRAHGSAARFKGMVQYRTRREILKVASFECMLEATSQAQIVATRRVIHEANTTNVIVFGKEKIWRAAAFCVGVVEERRRTTAQGPRLVSTANYGDLKLP